MDWDPRWFAAGATGQIDFVRLEVRGLSGSELALARPDGRILTAQPSAAGPWPIMMQWLGRVAVHGRAALLNDKTALAADLVRLRDANCIRGAQLLLELQGAAHQSSRAFDGSLGYLPEPLPKAWLALAVFAQVWLAAGP